MSYNHVEDDDESMICNVCPTTCAVEAYAHFELKIKASCGNNFTDFPKNQLTKFPAKC